MVHYLGMLLKKADTRLLIFVFAGFVGGLKLLSQRGCRIRRLNLGFPLTVSLSCVQLIQELPQFDKRRKRDQRRRHRLLNYATG